MKTVPFYSQIVNWNNEDSGFPDRAEIEKWEKNCCGIACLRMVIAALGEAGDKGPPSYWDLLTLGLQRGAYSDRGWIHQGLLGMAGLFGIQGRCHRQAGVEDLTDAIGRGSLCIVSVTRCFLGGQEDSAGTVLPRGGHLVVAYDVAGDAQGVTGIVCNHPSSSPAWNKPGWIVETGKWRLSFSGSFIELFAGTSGTSSAISR